MKSLCSFWCDSITKPYHIPTAFSLTSRFWSKSKKFWNSKPRSNDKSSNNAKITLATHQNHNLTLLKTFRLRQMLLLSHPLLPLHRCRLSRNRLHPLILLHTIHPHLPSNIHPQLIPIHVSLSNKTLTMCELVLCVWVCVCVCKDILNQDENAQFTNQLSVVVQNPTRRMCPILNKS